MARKKSSHPKNKEVLPSDQEKIKDIKKRKTLVKRKVSAKTKVEKPFADNSMTRSVFFGMLRSALRRKSMYWPCIAKVRKAAQIPYIGSNKRMKYAYVCGNCSEAVPSAFCAVHHKIECGTLKDFSDLAGFCERLFCDSDGLILLCNTCHDKMHPKKKEI